MSHILIIVVFEILQHAPSSVIACDSNTGSTLVVYVVGATHFSFADLKGTHHIPVYVPSK